MKATTVKISGELLEMVESAQRPGESVSAFVRDAVRRKVRQAERSKSADVFNQLLEADAEEAAWLAEWEKADLVAEPADETGERMGAASIRNRE